MRKYKSFIPGWIRVFSVACIILQSAATVTGQSRREMTEEIVNRVGLVETYMLQVIAWELRPAWYHASGADSIYLRDLERMLTEEEVQRRIIAVFDDFFTDNDIIDLYRFVLSDVFEKVWSGDFTTSIDAGFNDIRDKIDSISTIDQPAEEQESRRFVPIPTDREDGVYALVHYDPSMEDSDMELNTEPGIIPKDIMLIEKGYSPFDDKMLAIHLTLTEEGARKFYLLTKANIGKPLAIVVEKQILSMPLVHSAIPNGRLSISGYFSEEEADGIIEALNRGINK